MGKAAKKMSMGDCAQLKNKEHQVIRAKLLLAVTLLIVLAAAPAGAGVVGTFDGSGIGSTYTTFASLQTAHDTFMGTSDDVITFSDLAVGDLLSSQYTASKGVTFSNTTDWLNGVGTEGYTPSTFIVEALDGYDGTYGPDGDKVYVKVRNNTMVTPFTITFASPVTAVGSFVAMGKEGTIETLTLNAYDSSNALLGTLLVETGSWADPTNREGFWGIKCDVAEIAKVTITNDSSTDYATALILDNLEFSVPEPASMSLLGLGALAMLRRWRR